jgi:hypothetical protein
LFLVLLLSLYLKTNTVQKISKPTKQLTNNQQTNNGPTTSEATTNNKQPTNKRQTT